MIEVPVEILVAVLGILGTGAVAAATFIVSKLLDFARTMEATVATLAALTTRVERVEHRHDADVAVLRGDDREAQQRTEDHLDRIYAALRSLNIDGPEAVVGTRRERRYDD